MNARLILASASPRRQALLENVGLSFEVLPSDVNEEPLGNEAPEAHVRRLAAAKAKAVGGELEFWGECWVLGADTIVINDNELLGKPENSDDAIRMLQSLSGKEHAVMTGYCLYNPRTKQEITRAVETRVKIRELRDDEIAGYVASEEPMDKAGAYAIQGLGSFMVERISGSYSNVVGLPVCEVVRDLQNLGAACLFSK